MGLLSYGPSCILFINDIILSAAKEVNPFSQTERLPYMQQLRIPSLRLKKHNKSSIYRIKTTR
jgi:hypothetical protein